MEAACDLTQNFAIRSTFAGKIVYIDSSFCKNHSFF